MHWKMEEQRALTWCLYHHAERVWCYNNPYADHSVLEEEPEYWEKIKKFKFREKRFIIMGNVTHKN